MTGPKEYYARDYASRYHIPCDGCHPMYTAGYRAMITAIEEENFGQAYMLAMELDRVYSPWSEAVLPYTNPRKSEF